MGCVMKKAGEQSLQQLPDLRSLPTSRKRKLLNVLQLLARFRTGMEDGFLGNQGVGEACTWPFLGGNSYQLFPEKRVLTLKDKGREQE